MADIAGPPASNLFIVLPYTDDIASALVVCACNDEGHILRRHVLGYWVPNPDLDLMGQRLRRYFVQEIRRSMVGT